MKFKILKWVLLAPFLLFALLYVAGAIMVATDDRTIPTLEGDRSEYRVITLFGASGTAGDGILKAALADPDVETIHDNALNGSNAERAPVQGVYGADVSTGSDGSWCQEAGGRRSARGEPDAGARTPSKLERPSGLVGLTKQVVTLHGLQHAAVVVADRLVIRTLNSLVTKTLGLIELLHEFGSNQSVNRVYGARMTVFCSIGQCSEYSGHSERIHCRK